LQGVIWDKMGFFDEEDPFENIIREFFEHSSGQISNGPREFIKGEEEDRKIDFVETKDKIFLVFEIPGYSEKDIKVEIRKGEVIIKADKKNIEDVPNYLYNKLSQGFYIKKGLPRFVNHKKFKHTFKNGILEIVFYKK